jgi:hypothetical protein
MTHMMHVTSHSRPYHNKYTPWKKHFEKKNHPAYFYRGMLDTRGGKNSNYQSFGAMFVYPKGLPTDNHVFMSGLGYARGTLGFSSDIVIPAGKTVKLPVLFASANGKNVGKTKRVDLERMLAKVQKDLLKAIEDM